MTRIHAQPSRAPRLGDLLSEPLRIGEPDVAGPLAVYPVFAPEPRLRYLAFAQARGEGFRAGELAGGAAINDLMVENPTRQAVLLFEGEEVLGAQQNRTFDVSVLVAAGAKLRVPVSCVEAGRWQHERRHEALEPAPQAAYPRLRRATARRVRERVSEGMEARADQGEVWDQVADRSRELGTRSPTAAMADIYAQSRDRLARMREAIRLHDGQAGALVAIGGRFCVLDLVSDPEAFGALHGPLVEGYALDALDAEPADVDLDPPDAEIARGLVLLVGDCRPAQRRPGVGLGEELRFAADGFEGSALVHEGELICLTAFPTDGDAAATRRQARAGRVRRPSRRR
ncbi:MAG: hypothetical protein GEU88_15615 [Solirubrobacterales bacterium]|nr:hypothetical protein [Solirubrobacterales bacterium]